MNRNPLWADPKDNERLCRFLCQEKGIDPNALNPCAWTQRMDGSDRKHEPMWRTQMVRAGQLIDRLSDEEQRALALYHQREVPAP